MGISIEPQIMPLFATPIVIGDLSNDPGTLSRLADLILEQRRRESLQAKQKRGETWCSNSDFAHWGGPAAQVLRRQLVETADRFTLDVKGSGRYRWQTGMRAWAADAGESGEARGRPDAFWTALYFVSHGSGQVAGPGGELVIEDPRLPALLMEEPRLRLRRHPSPTGALFREEATVQPKPGQLLLFPSWLRFRHRIHRGEQPRLWISADLVARRFAA